MTKNITYTYHKSWDSIDGTAGKKYELNEALNLYNEGKSVFVVAQKEGECKPFAFIDTSGVNKQYINYLNDKLDIDKTYSYKIPHNLDKKRLLLSNFMVREFDYEDKGLYKHINKVSTYYFAHCDPEKEGFQWVIKNKVFCEESDYSKDEFINYESSNIINTESLWEDIPAFGNWDYFLRDDTERVKFLEVKD